MGPTAVYFGVLGPMQARCGDVERTIGAGKQRAVLASLLVRANEIVSLDELAEMVWDGRPPRAARATMRNYIKRLRHVLGPDCGDRIRTRAPGYLIELADHELDRLQFIRACGEGGAAVRGRDWQRASDVLAAGLALWRGVPLIDVPSQMLRGDETARLDQLHLQALEWRIDADLHLGRHALLIDDIRPLTVAHPLHERFHGQLIRALALSGRRGEALEAYRHARRIIVEELGVEPGAELQQLQRSVLGQNGPIATARPAGSSHITPRQLPTSSPRFIGRRRELAELDAMIAPSRRGSVPIAAIDGMAGTGKTTLAVHWAHQVVDRFSDGQLFADLRGFDPERPPAPVDEIIVGFLSALGASRERVPSHPDQRIALYRSLVARRRIVVVLDNATDADQVRPLLPGSPSCAVVTTSRYRLLGLIAAEGAVPISLDVLGNGESTHLLAGYAGAERAAAEPEATAHLVRACGGLPLALAIVGARATDPVVSMATLSVQLRHRDLLRQLDAGDRSTSVEAVFSWSYRKLSEPAARMLRLLALAPGPPAALAAAASLAGVPLDRARDQVTELVDAHLVTVHDHHRYAMHDLVRVYARRQADGFEAGADIGVAMRRLLDHYLHSAYAAAMTFQPGRNPMLLAAPIAGVVPEAFADDDAARDWFEAEHLRLSLLIGYAAEGGADRHAWQLAWTLGPFLDHHGDWTGWLDVERAGLAAATRLGDPAGQARSHHRLGHVLARLGRVDRGIAHVEAALEFYRAEGSRLGRAHAHVSLARQHDQVGRFDAARSHARRAEALFTEAGHRLGEADARHAIGWSYAREDRAELAAIHCRQALNIYLELGDRQGQAATWDSLGYAHHLGGDHGTAVDCFHRAAALLTDLHDRTHLAQVWNHLGDCHREAGDIAAAIDAWRAAVRVLEETERPAVETLRSQLIEFDGLS